MTRLIRFSLLVTIALFPVISHAQDLVLTNYTGEGSHSFVCMTNTLDHGLQLPGSTFCDPFGCTTVPGPVVNAAATYRVEMPKPANGIAGIVKFTSPDPGFFIDAEVITGAKALFRVPPLQPLDFAQFLNVEGPVLTPGTASPFNGFLFVAAEEDQVFGGVQLRAGEGAIFSTPSPTFAARSQLGTHFYIFAGVNSQTNGSLQLIAPH